MFKNNISLIFLLTLLFFSKVNFSQSLPEKEVILEKISSHKDSNFVLGCLELSQYYFNTIGNLDSLYKYSALGIEHGKKINYHLLDAVLYRQIGVVYYFNQDFNQSLEFYELSKQAAIKFHDPINLAKTLNNIGIIHYDQGEYQMALEYNLEIIKIYAHESNYLGLTDGCINAAKVYQSMGQNDKVHEYLLKCIELLPLIKEHETTQELVTSLASEYYIRITNTDTTKIDSALIYINMGMEIAERNNLKHRIGFYNNFYGAYYFQKKDYINAETYLKKALRDKRYLGKMNTGNSYLIMAQLKMKQENKTEALMYLDSIKQLDDWAKGFSGIPFHDVYYQVYKHFGDYENALVSFERVNFLRDSISNVEKIKALFELETKYKSEIKDAAIKDLNQERLISNLELENQSTRNKWLIGIIIIIVLVLLIIIVFYRQARIKNQYEILIAEQRLNRSRINPHFLNNAFTSIQAMALESDNEESLIELTSGVARYSRLLLESTVNEEWSMKNEIELIENFLLIYQQKFGAKWKIELTKNYTPPTVNGLLIPSALAQPLIENAFEHSSSLEEQAEIKIKFIELDHVFTIEIVNTLGKSLIGNKRKSDEKSRGLEIFEQRILLFNKKNKVELIYSFNIFEQQGYAISKIQIPK